MTNGIDHTNREVFQKRFKELRDEKGLKNTALAKELGFTRQYITNLAAGRFKVIRLSTVEALARRLWCTPQYLMGIADIPTQTKKSDDNGEVKSFSRSIRQYYGAKDIKDYIEPAMEKITTKHPKLFDAFIECVMTLNEPSLTVLTDIMTSFTEHLKIKELEYPAQEQHQKLLQLLEDQHKAKHTSITEVKEPI